MKVFKSEKLQQEYDDRFNKLIDPNYKTEQQDFLTENFYDLIKGLTVSMIVTMGLGVLTKVLSSH